MNMQRQSLHLFFKFAACTCDEGDRQADRWSISHCGCACRLFRIFFSFFFFFDWSFEICDTCFDRETSRRPTGEQSRPWVRPWDRKPRGRTCDRYTGQSADWLGNDRLDVNFATWLITRKLERGCRPDNHYFYRFRPLYFCRRLTELPPVTVFIILPSRSLDEKRREVVS